MSNKIIIALLSLNLYWSNAISQEVKDSTLYPPLTKFPVFSADYFRYPKADVNPNGGSGAMNTHELNTAFRFAIPIDSGKLFLFNSIRYTHLNLQAESASTSSTFRHYFHSFEYSLGFIKSVKNNWTLIANVSPTIASDFKEKLTSDDFIFQASVLAMIRIDKSSEFGAGLVYTSLFGKPLVFPLINYTKKKEDWLAQVVLPAFISLRKELPKRSSLGGKISIYGNLYNSNFSINSPDLDLNRITYSRINLGPEYSFVLFGDFYATVFGGFTFRNIFQTQDDQLRTEMDFNIDQKFFLKLSIALLK